MPAEYLGGDFQDRLLEVGAVDFFFTPIQMKKGRSGLNLTVLVREESLATVQGFLLEHTSTIGLRYYQVEREELERKQYEVDTPYGPLKVKEVMRPTGRRSVKVEYESLKRISKEQGKSVWEISEEVQLFIRTQRDER